MDVTLHLTEDESMLLRRAAAAEGRSPEDLLRAGLADRLRCTVLDAVLAEDLPRYRAALDRLGQ